MNFGDCFACALPRSPSPPCDGEIPAPGSHSLKYRQDPGQHFVPIASGTASSFLPPRAARSSVRGRSQRTIPSVFTPEPVIVYRRRITRGPFALFLGASGFGIEPPSTAIPTLAPGCRRSASSKAGEEKRKGCGGAPRTTERIGNCFAPHPVLRVFSEEKLSGRCARGAGHPARQYRRQVIGEAQRLFSIQRQPASDSQLRQPMHSRPRRHAKRLRIAPR